MNLLHTRSIALTESHFVFKIDGRQIQQRIGTDLPALGAGWQLDFLLALGDVYCLVLRKADHYGFWYLNEHFKLIATSSDGFVKLQDLALTHPSYYLNEQITTDCSDLVLSQDVSVFIADMARSFARLPAKVPEIVIDQPSPAYAAAMKTLNGYNRPIGKPTVLGQVVSVQNFELGYVETVDFDLKPIKVDIFLPLENFCYVGFSSESERPLAFLISGHTKVAQGLYDLADNKIYCRSDLRGLKEVHFTTVALWRMWFFSKIKEFSKNAERVGLVFRENHIGHHLWNELSAIDIVQASGNAVSVYTYPSCDEPLFKLEEIFPTLDGHVRRNINVAQESLAILSTGVRFFPFMAYQVTESVANRLIELSRQKELAVLQLLTAIRKTHFVLLIGLRLENRSWVKQQAGYIALIKELAAKSEKRVAIIFDGHNVSSHDPAAFVKSHNEQHQPGSMPPIIQQERAMIDFVSDELQRQGVENVDIINFVPQNIALSILASTECDYFVTHWGAGLAKYKWIANAPGCIISSRNVLEGKGDLRIYDTSDFRENAEALDYIDSKLISDIGHETNVIRISDGQRGDFDLDPEAFARFVVPLALARQ